MFFIMGITSRQKNLDFNQVITCPACGAYARFQVFMTYTVLTFFFLPVFKWNRKYYVRTSCCNTEYLLDADIGKRIARGEQVNIQMEHLQKTGRQGQFIKRCRNCGYGTWENFAYCPRCGRPL